MRLIKDFQIRKYKNGNFFGKQYYYDIEFYSIDGYMHRIRYKYFL